MADNKAGVSIVADGKVHPIRNREVREELRAALDWLRDFLETMMAV